MYRGRSQKKTEPNCYCSNCGKPIRRKPSRLKEFAQFYCSRKCKHESQRKLPEERSYSRQRADLVKALGGECSVCGYNKIVEIHHINGRVSDEFDNLMALCPNCHLVKHIGHATNIGLGLHAVKHLAKINKWSTKQALDYRDKAYALWLTRSRFSWEMNISFIEEYIKSNKETTK